MPRTRDLFLFGTVLAFLLVAIAGTVFSQFEAKETRLPELNPTSPAIYTASVAGAANELDRAQKLAAMREKIAAVAPDFDESEFNEFTIEEIDVESMNEEVVTDTGSIALECPDSAPYAGAWDPLGLQFTTAEGVRVVYREAFIVTGSTTQPQIETVLQLPMRSFPDARPQCITGDVVGIAQDGSLIRNDELALYGVFGSETLIGFSLDGFPIYGVGTQTTDVCGGAIVAGQYSYYLSAERDTVLGCFAAPPVNLTDYGNARF